MQSTQLRITVNSTEDLPGPDPEQKESNCSADDASTYFTQSRMALDTPPTSPNSIELSRKLDRSQTRSTLESFTTAECFEHRRSNSLNLPRLRTPLPVKSSVKQRSASERPSKQISFQPSVSRLDPATALSKPRVAALYGQSSIDSADVASSIICRKQKKLQKERHSSLGRAATDDGCVMVLELRRELQRYAQNQGKDHQPRLLRFRKLVPIEERMTWQRNRLDSPLTRCGRQNGKNALKAFICVQAIMESTDDKNHMRWGCALQRDAQFLAQLGIGCADLRDEIYLQVCKQLSRTPILFAERRGWQLMQILAISFPPSRNLLTAVSPLLVHTAQLHRDSQIRQLAQHANFLIDYQISRGSRGRPPSLKEIERTVLSAFQPVIFSGRSLQSIQEYSRTTTSPVPSSFVFLCNAVLALGGTSAEGIFRIPADVENLYEVRSRLNEGCYSLEVFDGNPHLAAASLKSFLRDLREPLIAEELYADCLQASRDIQAILRLLSRLPLLNRRVFAFLIAFLQLFTQPTNVERTKMTARGLAMVMAPSCLRSQTTSLAIAFQNTPHEQVFMRTIIEELVLSELDLEGAVISFPAAMPQCVGSNKISYV